MRELAQDELAVLEMWAKSYPRPNEVIVNGAGKYGEEPRNYNALELFEAVKAGNEVALCTMENWRYLAEERGISLMQFIHTTGHDPIPGIDRSESSAMYAGVSAKSEPPVPSTFHKAMEDINLDGI